MRAAIAVMLGVTLVACARPPYVNSIYVGPEPVVAKSDTASVAVFLPDNPPQAEYELLGTIEVSSMRAKRTADDMLRYAKARARRMGADAIIDVTFESRGGSTSTKPVVNTTTGKVIWYDTDVSVLRVLTAKAARWKR